MRVWLILVLLILSIALESSRCREDGQQPRGDAKNITLAVVRAKSATILQPYPGQIVSAAPVFVRSPVKGRVAAVLAKEGQAVKRGDLLFEVEPDRDESTPPVKDRDKVVAIEAPCNGLVWHFRPPNRGDTVEKNEHILTLGDEGAVRILFRITEIHYLELMAERRPGSIIADIHLASADQSNYPHVGKIVAFLGGSSETGDIAAAADFPNPHGELHQNQACTLLIRRMVKDAISIPRQATFLGPRFRKRSQRLPILTWSERLRHSGSPIAACLGVVGARFEPIDAFLNGLVARFEVYANRYVYLVDENRVAHRREIIVEDDANGLMIVRRGIGAGDRIVVEGVGGVHDEDEVE